MEAEVDEGVLARSGDDEDGAASAAVAAVGAAAGDELLATEAETAPAAVAGGHVDVDFVDEHGLRDQASGSGMSKASARLMPETALNPDLA